MNVLAANTRLNQRFVIANSLNVGGMGAIYLAFDSQNAQTCVVKEMLDPYTDPAERAKAIQQFDREADMLAALSHPHIPKILARFTENDHHYLVMEYVHGVNLEQLLQQRGAPLPEDEVVAYTTQVLDLLDYLHAQNPQVVYRDLKPANLMRRLDGQIMMIDFGIARFFNPMARGTMIGTPGYAPPEQYQGLAEPRSDLFALGATMFHLLTNRDPRDPRNLIAPWVFPLVTTIDPNFTPGLAYIIAKALSMDLDSRYSSAKAMATDLQNYRTLTPPPTAPLAPSVPTSTPQPSRSPLAPVLAVDTKSIDFGSVSPNAAALTKSFSITNPIAATHTQVFLAGSIDANQPWITLDTASFKIGAERATIQVTIDPKTLTNGQQSGAVIVTSNGGTETVVVLVNVIGPALAVSPKQIALGTITAGQTREAAFFINNTNPRGGNLIGTLASDQVWARPGISSFQTRDRQVIKVFVSAQNVAAGNQRATITVRSNGGTQSVELAMQVIAPALSVNPPVLNFGDLMRNQKMILAFKLTNTGDGILEGTFAPSVPWIRTNVSNFRMSKNVPITVQVMVEALNLAREREYVESIRIQSNGGTELVTIRFFVVAQTFGESLQVALANQGVEFK